MTRGMNAKRAVKKYAMTDAADPSEVDADAVLLKIAELYRERFRAYYNNDLLILYKIDRQIDTLRATL
jgi:hypothetical protein